MAHAERLAGSFRDAPDDAAASRASDNVRPIIAMDGDSLPPRLPAGSYVVQSGKSVVVRVFSRRALLLPCEVVEGEHAGARLFWSAQLPPPGRRPGISS